MKTISNPARVANTLKNSHYLDLFSFDARPYVRVVEYEKNEYVIRGNGPLTRLCYLVKGTAKLYGVHKNGKQTLINFFWPPCILGDTELVFEGKLPFPLVAQTKCVFIELDTRHCRQMLLSDAKFLRCVYGMALKRNVAQNRKYINLAAYPSKNNLAACLLQLQNEGLFTEKYTEIADYLSVSYRHLMHLVMELCEENIVERVPEGLRIVDWEQLRTLSSDIVDEDD